MKNETEEKVLILLGKAGCGKGTQSEILKNKYNLFHISTGDIIRENIKNDTELGKKVKEYTSKGQLVPDEVVCEIVLDKVHQIRENNEENYNGFIFDGFPRTSIQLDFLANEVLTISSKSFIIDYILDDETTKSRIKNRAKEMGDKARKDDLDDNIIQNRLEEYNKNHSIILDTYKKYSDKISFIKVDARENKESIFEETCKCIDSSRYLSDIHNKKIENSLNSKKSLSCCL